MDSIVIIFYEGIEMYIWDKILEFPSMIWW